MKKIRIFLVDNNLMPNNGIGITDNDAVDIFAKSKYNETGIKDFKKWVIDNTYYGKFKDLPTISQKKKKSQNKLAHKNLTVRKLRVYLIEKKLIPESQLGFKHKTIIKIFANIENLTIDGDIIDWIVDKQLNGDFNGWPLQTSKTKAIRALKRKEKQTHPKPTFKEKSLDQLTWEVKLEYYHEYLKSPEWRKVSRAVIKRDGNKCVRCEGTEILQAHHKTYAHIFNEMEYLEDLETLCKKCHDIETNKQKQKRNGGKNRRCETQVGVLSKGN